MTAPMTVDEARRLIELCREVDGNAAAETCEWHHGGLISDDAEAAIVLWRAGFGALLHYLQLELDGFEHCGGTSVDWHGDPFAPLAEWADREHEGWREKR